MPSGIKRHIPSESSQTKDATQQKFPSECFKAKDFKRTFPRETSKRKMPSEISQATDPKQMIPGDRSQTKDANQYVTSSRRGHADRILTFRDESHAA